MRKGFSAQEQLHAQSRDAGFLQLLVERLGVEASVLLLDSRSPAAPVSLPSGRRPLPLCFKLFAEQESARNGTIG